MEKVTLRGELLHPSRFVAAADLKGRDTTVTIKEVKTEKVQMKTGGKFVEETKPIIYFTDAKKPFICNKTNADSIAHIYGKEAEAWTGKRITLYPTRVQCGRETVDAIRVREKVPGGKAAPATTPAPAVDVPIHDDMPFSEVNP